MTIIRKINWLFSSRSFQKAPFISAIRLAYWIYIYCLIVHKTYELKLKNGQIIYLPPQKRGLAKFIFSFKDNFDFDDIMVIHRILKPGDIFIDVGANLGFYSVVASEFVGADGKVIAFEPAEETFQYLSRTAVCARYQNIIANNVALSNIEQSTRLFHHPDPSRNSLGDMGTNDFEIVKTSTLDKKISDLGVDRVDFIKCDVEGLEELVFLGSQDLISRFHPALYFEINIDAIQKAKLHMNGAWSLLQNAGYSFFAITKTGSLEKIVDIPRGGNILALYGDIIP